MKSTETYYIAKKGYHEPVGPFSLQALQSMAKCGMLHADHLYAVDGMRAWEPVSKLPGIGALLVPFKGVRPASHLAISILLTLCCFPPTALIAVFYAFKVDSRYNSGDVEGARKCADAAAAWCMVTLMFGIVMWLCLL